MNKKYLFLTQSDLNGDNANGKTLRDVFGYVENKDILSFCTSRYNKDLEPTQTFCIKEKDLFKKKHIHIDAEVKKGIKSSGKIKKNSLTCLIRNLLWNISFLTWKNKYKKWVINNKPDFVIFNPSDFIFMHKLSKYTSKLLNKKTVIYNTEDYSQKVWGYLKDNKFTKIFYKLFRKKLVRAYNKSFNSAYLVMHNTIELCNEYKTVYHNINQVTIYHPSNIEKNIDEPLNNDKRMYYGGTLDNSRCALIIEIANILKEIDKEFIIEINGQINYELLSMINKIDNIKYQGLVPYSKVREKILNTPILLNVVEINDSNFLNRRHAFSTKTSDYIASLNIIFSVEPENDEYRLLKSNNLGYVSKTMDEVRVNLISLMNEFSRLNNPFKKNMEKFYNNEIKSDIVCSKVKKLVED